VAASYDDAETAETADAQSACDEYGYAGYACDEYGHAGYACDEYGHAGYACDENDYDENPDPDVDDHAPDADDKD
jgi:hypothetical protein